jgi:preprotein translocase subunit SecG
MTIWYLRLPTPKIEPPAVGTLSSSGRTALLMLVCVAGAAIGGYKAALIAMDGLSNYRVIYTLLTRSIAWFALLYLLAGLFVSFTRKPEPVAEI